MTRRLEKPYGPVLSRLMQAYGVTSLGELARLCGAPENTVRNWHKRDSVPLARIRQAVADTGKAFEWFMTSGSSSLFLAPEAKELAKCAAGDAFGQGHKVTENTRELHPSPSAGSGNRRANQTDVQQNVPEQGGAKSLDAALLAGVLAAVLAELDARGLRLTSGKLAELVSLIYEDVSAVAPAERMGQTQRTASRYLRLVA